MRYVINCLVGMCVAFCLLLGGCGRQQKVVGEVVSLGDLTPVTVPVEPDSVIEIKNWLAIGPFTFNPLLTDPVKSFSRNDLKRYGIREGLIDNAGIEKLQQRGAGVFLIDEPSPQIRLLKYVSGNTEKMSNFYLAARIHSAVSREAMLVFDGSYSYAAWLNGDKLLEVRGKYNLNKAGDRFVNVSLKAGDNLLFVKVGRGTNKRSWDLICAITTPQEGGRIFRVNYANDFVVNPVTGSTLAIYTGPYRNGKVEVLDAKGQTVAGGSFDNLDTNGSPFTVAGLSKLEDGFYRTVLSVGNERLEQVVYKGDYTGFVKKAKAGVAAIPGGSPYTDDLEAALQRVDFLNSKPKEDAHSPDETRFVNRNRVFWGYALSEMLRKNAGTQLMTYRAETGNPGVFIFHHRDRHRQNMPLVIIVPSDLQGTSMIEDWYTSNLDQIETDHALADRYGFAVAWIYAGGQRYSAINTEKEISAVLNRLQSEYDIDTHNIFIVGDCEGGRRALVQLALTPERYAACVAASPITLTGGNDGIPINLLPRMGNVPVLIRHGTDDDVSPVENSRRFYAEAQKLDMPVEYVEVPGSHINVAKDGHGYVFAFFSGRIR